MTTDTKRVLQSLGQVRGVDIERHTVTAVISTGNVARDGAAINPVGWHFENYLLNPVILFNHDVSKLPVARTIELKSVGTDLVATAEFDMANEHAADLFNSIARGFLKGTSVRWTPMKTEVRRISGKEVLYFAEQDLVEWSFCPVPVDPTSLVIRSIEGAPLKVEDFVPSDEAKRALNLPNGMSYDDLCMELREQFTASLPCPDGCWITDVYADTVIFCVADDYWQQSYAVDAQGVVTLSGTPVEVERLVQWQPVAARAVAGEAVVTAGTDAALAAKAVETTEAAPSRAALMVAAYVAVNA